MIALYARVSTGDKGQDPEAQTEVIYSEIMPDPLGGHQPGALIGWKVDCYLVVGWMVATHLIAEGLCCSAKCDPN